MNDNWRAEVYGQDFWKELLGQDDFRIHTEKTKPRILKRDNYRCKRCRNKFDAIRLSVHHIIPRDEGGSNEDSNLITLCVKCHDIIEAKEYRTRDEIEDDLYKVKIFYDVPPRTDEWYKWVYGGKQIRHVGDCAEWEAHFRRSRRGTRLRVGSAEAGREAEGGLLDGPENSTENSKQI